MAGGAARPGDPLPIRPVLPERAHRRLGRAELEASLKRYQTDYFDIFNFWGTNTPEMHRHILEHGALEAALQAREGGVDPRHRAHHARTPEWIRDFVDAYPWECIILKEHMLYSRNQEVIDYLGSKGIRVVVMTPSQAA